MIILIFLINLCEMIYELVASRAISPYYGNGNYTMTAIIAVMLLSGSLGNLIGGKLTRCKYKYTILEILFMVGAFFIIITIPGLSVLAPLFNNVFPDMRVSISVSSLLFFVPALIMGVFTPIAMDDILSKYPKDKIGEINGRIHAVIAVGSLLGTVLGGFVLIPTLGTNLIFVIIAFFMVIVAAIYLAIEAKASYKIEKLVPKIAVLCVPVFLIIWQVSGVLNTKVFNYSDVSNEMSFDTDYGRIIICDSKDENGNSIRYYISGNSYSSATYLDEDKKYEPVFEYISTYDLSYNYLDIKDTLMIGGAGYSYPKHVISSFSDVNMDVVEINGKSTEIAKEYFFLDDLIEEYGENRLNCITADGRVFLDQSDKKYDAIYNDAFSGGAAIPTLSTVEFANILKNHLSDNGIYMSNVIGPLTGKYGIFIRSEAKTLWQIFDYVYIIPVNNRDANKTSNWILVATDNPYIPDDTDIINISFENGDYILTDDFCPVEILNSYEINKRMAK